MYQPPSPFWRARPLLILVAVGIIIALTRQTTPPVIAPPHALGAPPAALSGDLARQPAAAPAALAGYDPVLLTDRLLLYTSDGSYSTDQVRALAEPLDAALGYVADRTGMQLTSAVAVAFDRRADCGFDGAAYTEERRIVLYVCQDVPAQRAINILAHEFVHQLAQDTHGPAHLRADLILSEGLATYGAGRYWLGREPDFRRFVQHNYGTSLLPLGSHYRDYGTITAMNQLYYQWASFVEFLLESYGMDAFRTLYASDAGTQPANAAYQDVLGADFGSLEQRWQIWLSQEE